MVWKLQGLKIAKRKGCELDRSVHRSVPTHFSPDRGHGLGLFTDKHAKQFGGADEKLDHFEN